MSRRDRRTALAFLLALATLLALGASSVIYESPAQKASAQREAQLEYARQHLGLAAVVGIARGDADALTSATAPGKRGEGGRLMSVAEEEARQHDYPATSVPGAVIENARSTFQRVSSRRSKRRAGAWRPIGPSVAFQPGQLNFSGADYVTSGRVTALEIGPTCSESRCVLWSGAAGGGVWRTTKALSKKPRWEWVSEEFGTNAIGSLHLAASSSTPSSRGRNDDDDDDDEDGRGGTRGLVIYAGTGEGNASVDSEAGVGIYKSTDGGDSWTLLEGSRQFFGRSVASITTDPRNPNVIYAGIARAVRGISSVPGGPVSTQPPGMANLGLWKSSDGGQTFQLIWDRSTQPGNPRGVREVELDPRDPDTIYVSAFGAGIWRSSPRLDGTAEFRQVFAGATDPLNLDRVSFDVTVKNGKARIYAGDGQVGPQGGVPIPSMVWRVDNADVPAAALLASQAGPGGWENLTSSAPEDPRYATWDYCTGQCWYDNYVASPDGAPDHVWVGGSYAYGELGGISNGRAVLRSTTAGDPDPANNLRTFADLTWDSGQVVGGGDDEDADDDGPASRFDTPDSLHPDSQAIVFHPTNPNIAFMGSDGGVVRTDGEYVDRSDWCNGRPTGTATQTCRRLFSAVPRQHVNMNAGLETLQFWSLSPSPRRPLDEIIGGTQDNGTWHFTGNTRRWNQTLYGDGGQSGIDPEKPNVFFNMFFNQFGDGNFRGGDPAWWVVTTAPLANSVESSYFYIPHIQDPVVSGTRYAGLEHVWRTKSNGGDQAFLEANCTEFNPNNFNKPGCGDYVSLGGPDGPNQPGNLVGSVYGADRQGGSVAAVERTKADQNTLWAATGTGRIFVTKNARMEPASAVVWDRIDDSAANDPGRFPTSIYVDPANSNRAWISYAGYNVMTPAQPGHVFLVHYNPATGTATWADLNVENRNGDLPVTDLVRDDVSGDLYAATDFGVLRLPAGQAQWETAGDGLPMVEVAGLSIVPEARVLYAATHGRSAWSLRLPGRPPGIPRATGRVGGPSLVV